MELTEFLLARIAVDERNSSDIHRGGCDSTDPEGCCDCPQPTRVLAECEAKRQIVEFHKSWPVLVETPPQFENVPGDVTGMTYRLTQQIAWTTQEEYRKRFGEEPPTAPILRFLALPYADHPNYRPEWKP